MASVVVFSIQIKNNKAYLLHADKINKTVLLFLINLFVNKANTMQLYKLFNAMSDLNQLKTIYSLIGDYFEQVAFQFSWWRILVNLRMFSITVVLQVIDNLFTAGSTGWLDMFVLYSHIIVFLYNCDCQQTNKTQKNYQKLLLELLLTRKVVI